MEETALSVRRKARRRRIAWLAFPLFLCAAAAVLYWWNPGYVFRSEVNWTTEEVEQKILATISKGMSRADVEALFDEHSMSHSCFDVDLGDKYDNDGTSEAKSAGLSKKDFRKWMRGEISEAEVGFLFVLRIYVYVFFDDQDKVITRRMKTFSIGL